LFLLTSTAGVAFMRGLAHQRGWLFSTAGMGVKGVPKRDCPGKVGSAARCTLSIAVAGGP
jgi:hypothetical protein